jgi:hypothetical protein
MELNPLMLLPRSQGILDLARVVAYLQAPPHVLVVGITQAANR